MDAAMIEANAGLLDLAGLENLQSLALIGLSKNAGKTTCLNHIVTAWHTSGQPRPLALTSIGRDGEQEDILSGRAKPRIYIPAGTIIASAEGSLQRSDALLEILELTNVRTAFGEVIICRALSDGYVELAGPGASEEIAIISELILQHEPECLFIIDGALSRRSQAGSDVSEAAILAVSAETSAVPEILAEKTTFALNLLQTPRISTKERTNLAAAMNDHLSARAILLSQGKHQVDCKAIDLPSLVGFGQDISKELEKNTFVAFLKGAVTDQVITELFKEPHFANLTLVVEDGTRLFLKTESMHKLQSRKIDLAVLEALDVRLVCLNPTRANGQLLNPELLLEALRLKITNIPVVDLGPANL
jgi:hypothetical protein